jgi:hypothetical protein
MERGRNLLMVPSLVQLLLLLFLVTNSVVHALAEGGATTTEESQYLDIPWIDSIPDDLWYDENDKLATHYLVFPAPDEDDEKDCIPWSYKVPYGFQSIGLSGRALEQVFGGVEATATGTAAATTDTTVSTDGACRAACLERGTDRSVAHAVLPYKHYHSETDGDFTLWFKSKCHEVEVCFVNYHDRDHPIQSYWARHGAAGNKNSFAPHMEIKYGEKNTRCFFSFIGHQFQIVDHRGILLDEFTIDFSLVKGFGESPPSGDMSERSVEAEVIRDLKNEWNKHNQVKRTFSTLGFAKGRLPDDVFATMAAFYYNNRFHKVREEWAGKGVFVNWWETEVFFIQIPWRTKEKWQTRLRELVEAWAGVPVEQTVMYGLRQYETGARLLTHVDRISTHAVSLIVNIAQGNLTEPWPVEVHDHADRLHEVIMEPGDVVYYESAKNLHGRNRPMKGKNAYYANLFTHYRPVGDDKWYQKPNHDGAPEPLLELEGACRLKQVSVAETPGHTVGMVSAVECDDRRVGRYLSPTLFKATGPGDLIEWWRRTTPIADDPPPQCEQPYKQKCRK